MLHVREGKTTHHISTILIFPFLIEHIILEKKVLKRQFKKKEKPLALKAIFFIRAYHVSQHKAVARWLLHRFENKIGVGVC